MLQTKCLFYFKNLSRTHSFRKLLGCTKNMDSQTWRGVPLSEIYGSQSPWGAPEFSLIVPSYEHVVLYHIPSGGRPASCDVPPKPKSGNDEWNNNHVRMPCSLQSLYPVENADGEVKLKKRWNIIVDSLSKPIHNSEDLVNAILSYNTKFKSVWKFRALHKLFNEYLEEEESEYFFNVTLPEIVKLALSLPKLVQSPIPLLKQNKNMSLSMSQQQIASLLANAFFCTFPRRNTTKKCSEYTSYPHINFNRLFNASGYGSVMEKLKCLCHYFRRVCTKVPTGVATFSRRCVSGEGPAWEESDASISSVPLHVDSEVAIEDLHGLIQVDFANKYLGGGVLNFGCVQEEIRFVISPELMVSMLFSEMLKPNEAFIMIGCERYSSYSGYGKSFQWNGNYVDTSPYDGSGRRRIAVLALDALPLQKPERQYTAAAITRDLQKAWIGMTYGMEENAKGLQYPGVATGNWGCGAFGGCPRLKWLLQLMAAAHSGRPLAYCSYHDTALRDHIYRQYCALAAHRITVGQLYSFLIEYTSTDNSNTELSCFLQQKLDNTKPRSPQIIVRMETNSVTAMDIPQIDLTDSFHKKNMDSPDLFSQDDSDRSFSEYNSQISELMDAAERGELTEKTANLSTAKVASSRDSASTQTIRLFEEMQKIDEQGGKLNLTAPNTSLHEHDVSTTTDGATDAMDGDVIVMDVSPEVKKKISKKITDYFTKKTI